MSAFKKTFDIKGIPPLVSNGSHGSWQLAARIKRTWKAKLAREMVGHAPMVPFERLRATFTRFSSVEPDEDNLIISFKPVRDALVKYGFVVDDRRANLEAHYRWEHAPAKHGRIRVEVEEIRG